MAKSKGWRKDSARHSLASRGVKTKRSEIQNLPAFKKFLKQELRAYYDPDCGDGPYVVAPASAAHEVRVAVVEADEWGSESDLLGEPGYPEAWNKKVVQFLAKKGIPAKVYVKRPKGIKVYEHNVHGSG